MNAEQDVFSQRILETEQITDDCAKHAEVAISAFIAGNGEATGHVVADLIADLQHWCDKHNVSFHSELERGRQYYSEETTKAGRR